MTSFQDIFDYFSKGKMAKNINSAAAAMPVQNSQNSYIHHVNAINANAVNSPPNPAFNGVAGANFGSLGSPNFTGLVNGPIVLKPDLDSSITGIHSLSRGQFFARKEAEIEAMFGDAFDMDGEIFPTQLDISEGKNEFHFLVWQSMWGSDIRDYGFLIRMPNSRTMLVFKTQQSRDQFETWFDAYRDRYPDRNTKDWRLPTIQQGRVGGCFANRKSFSETEVIEVWAWIIGHCSGSAAFLPNFILFDEENDALNYRLRWG